MSRDTGVAATPSRLPAPGFPRYRVTSNGLVIGRNGAPLVGQIDSRGYRRVHISSASGFRKVRVHRLICEAFHGPPPAGHEVCHIDGNQLNNSAENLMWGTRALNVQQAMEHGTHWNSKERRHARG